MIRWCCYCQQVQGEKAPYDEPVFSHGLCQLCAEKLERGEALAANTEVRRDLIARILAAARDADDGACTASLNEALGLGLDSESILVGMLQPALYQAGLDWHKGTMSHEAEHRLTDWCERVFAMLEPPAPIGAAFGLLIFPTPGNRHTVGPRFAAQILRARGWSVEATEDPLSLDEMVARARTIRPRLIGFSCALPAAVPVAVNLIEQLRARLEPEVTCGYVLSGFAFRFGGAAIASTIPAGIEVAVDLDYFRNADAAGPSLDDAGGHGS